MNYRNATDVTDYSRKRDTTPHTSRRALAEDRTRLYLLSYLLTADRAKAEQCSVDGLDMSAEDNAAIRDWAHSWARRIVITNALQLIAPRPETGVHDTDFGKPR